MFRHKPTTLERISDAISDIGDRIVDLEERVVERVNPSRRPPSGCAAPSPATCRAIPAVSPDTCRIS